MAIKMIFVGTSLGGVSALGKLLSMLPNCFSIPVAVVIHRGSFEFDYLIDSIQKHTSLNVQEALDKQAIEPSFVTISPASYHLLVEENHFALSTDFAVNHARPSIDVLMESGADNFGSEALGIILTGGGNDGVRGLKAIKDNGGHVLVQNPDDCEDPTIAQAVIQAGIATKGYSIEELAIELSAYADVSGF
jgi:two-component system chemotaxis response regulator CheB